MAMARIVVPPAAKQGEIVNIRTLFQHPMETGYRRDHVGAPIPRHIVKTFTAVYNGVEIFRADMTQGIAANPYFAFSTVAAESGEIVFTWTDEHGAAHSEKSRIKVL
jgi:sulfur-oxidizing protein SoxZ